MTQGWYQNLLRSVSNGVAAAAFKPTEMKTVLLTVSPLVPPLVPPSHFRNLFVGSHLVKDTAVILITSAFACLKGSCHFYDI